MVIGGLMALLLATSPTPSGADGRGGVAWIEYGVTVNEIRKICLDDPFRCAELLLGCG